MNDTDPTEEYRSWIYVGSSKSTDDDFSIEAAAKDAYDRATAGGRTPPYRVLEIRLHGTNPFSEYRVAVGPGGG
jgi:hypothetical protein